MFVRKSTYNALLQDAQTIIDEQELELDETLNELIKYKNTLQYIVEQETSAPNATMLRVLNAAKEALGQ